MLWFHTAAHAQYHVYVGALDESSVTLAWGTTSGSNTIGRSARAPAPTTVTIGDRELQSDASWLRVDGLLPDTVYPYRVQTGTRPPVTGTVRTWPRQADSITFLVIGDWGNRSSGQYAIAARMAQEMKRLEREGKPVRFVLSTGDNIYGRFSGSGSKDQHWESAFFAPYQNVIAQVPMYAVPGNHDGNESESREDLAAYLDNFFFPGNQPARWYRFQIGGLAEFFALDSTRNQPTGPPQAVYAPSGEQSLWLKNQLAQPGPEWRIAWMHHPMFTAGPDHPPSLAPLRHWFDAFGGSHVNAVFAGHEHNFQFSQRNAATGNIQFVVSGAGGELRDGDVRRAMDSRHIAAWAPQRHFCIVEIDHDEMRITPVSDAPLNLRDASGNPVPVPLRIPLRR